MNSEIYKEDLSISYLRAIAAKAEIDLNVNRRDTESRDVNLSKIIFTDKGEFNSELNIQLKATSSKSQYRDEGDSIVYKLKVKNYNDLCRKNTTPIILGLLILPEDKEEWVKQTAEDLTMKKCMYWISLIGEQTSNNSNTCDVKIPKTNIITEDTLNALLVKIAENGGEL